MDDKTLVEQGFGVLQDCVRAGRKLKNEAKVSFKERPFLVRFKIPFSIAFSINRDDNSKVIRTMLKADEIFVEEDSFDCPFESSEYAEKFTNFSGVTKSGEVEAQLWTAKPIWS